MKNSEKDKWDKVNIILQPVGGLLTALAIAGFGLFSSHSLESMKRIETENLEKMKADEMRVQLYADLMSKREESESALRKDMFRSIIDSFLKPGSATDEERVLNLELLAYNFHESLNLKPLFIHLRKQIIASKEPAEEEYLGRLEKVAREITRRQVLALNQAGASFDRQINKRDKTINIMEDGTMFLPEATLTVNEIKRDFGIHVMRMNQKEKKIDIEVTVTTYRGAGREQPEPVEFSVGFFDFPMIDNTRLSDDQRFAVILNEFKDDIPHITLICFPGSYASLKDKPYYEDVLQNLKKTTMVLDENETE